MNLGEEMNTHDIELPAEFRSGNSIPVERATITRERMAEILQDTIEAALQSQDRENAVNRDVEAEQIRDVASSVYQTAMAFGMSQANFERLAYQIFDNNSRILDHARRIEGEG